MKGFFVYMFLGADESVLYIGSSIHLVERIEKQHFLSQHGNLSEECILETNKILYHQSVSADDMKIKERYLINTLKPKYNDKLNNNNIFSFTIDLDWKLYSLNTETMIEKRNDFKSKAEKKLKSRNQESKILEIEFLQTQKIINTLPNDGPALLGLLGKLIQDHTLNPEVLKTESYKVSEFDNFVKIDISYQILELNNISLEQIRNGIEVCKVPPVLRYRPPIVKTKNNKNLFIEHLDELTPTCFEDSNNEKFTFVIDVFLYNFLYIFNHDSIDLTDENIEEIIKETMRIMSRYDTHTFIYIRKYYGRNYFERKEKIYKYDDDIF